MRSFKSLTRSRLSAGGLAIGCLVLAAATALAKGKPSAETPTHKFSVSQPDVNDDGLVNEQDQGLLIVGTWLFDADGVRYLSNDIRLLCGRAGSSNVVINNPSPAIQLPMLLDFVDEDGSAWTDTNDPYRISGGTLVLNASGSTGGPTATYFFGACNKAGDNQMHRLDADALILGPSGDPLGNAFPLGAGIGETYTVFLSNWYLSHDTGSGKLAYEGPVHGGETIIMIRRTE